MIHINYLAVLVAAIVQFIIGAVWYMPIFGKMWGKIHGFDAHTPETQADMQKKMLPLLLVQFLITLLTSFVFALLLNGFPPNWNVYGLAFFFWLGFVFPTQVAAVIFGGTDPKWIMWKIGIMAGGSLACYEALAFVIQFMR